jgi:hypothetical protein
MNWLGNPGAQNGIPGNMATGWSGETDMGKYG